MTTSATRAYDYWLFDLDGTVVDAEFAYKRELVERVGDRLGHSFSRDDVTTIWDGVGGERDDLLAEWGLDPERFWSVFDDLDDPAARAEATYLYDDAARVGDLEGPVGLVTHCPAHVTTRVLDHLDAADWFDVVVSCDETVGWKPDPGPVEAAVADLPGRPGGDGILVGDGAADVGAAWNAGLDGAHVERHGPDRRGHCVLGDYRVDRLTQLWAATDGGPTAGGR
ncbi:MAG: HAD family hydrolase [Halobacteriaceae archaeon]